MLKKGDRSCYGLLHVSNPQKIVCNRLKSVATNFRAILAMGLT